MDDKEIDSTLKSIRDSNLWKQDFNDLYDVFTKAIIKIDLIPEVHKSLINVNLTSDFIMQKIETMLKQFDLSIPQKNILEALYYTNVPLTQMQLSKFVFSSKSNISSILERMENKGLIKRCENKNNKREKLVEITNDGINLIKCIFKSTVKTSSMYNNLLSDDEAKELNRLLFKLKNGFEELNFDKCK